MMLFHVIMVQLPLKLPSMPMHFIVMDLIGKFKPLPHWHWYSLTVIDILINYTGCILVFMKEADKVVHAFFVNVYSKFGENFIRQLY